LILSGTKSTLCCERSFSRQGNRYVAVTVWETLSKLNANAVVTSYLRKSDNEPTSIILVSKSTSTPDFIAEKIVKLKSNSEDC
jgi:hypothetical protein